VDDTDSDDLDSDDDSPAASSDSDDDVDYTGFSLLTGELFDDILEDDDDTPDKPAPIANRKVVKVKKNKNKGTLKNPQNLINAAVPAQNDVNSNLNSQESANDKPATSLEATVPASVETISNSLEQNEDDDEEEDDDGILSLMSTLLGKS
jgi:hypothetical protein